MKPWTRRQFLQISAATALAPAAPSKPDLSPFPYGSVTLLPGPLRKQFDQNHDFFLNLGEDRLLKIYRQRAGLPAPGEDMGGWYDDFCPGAHFGQYLSALARFAAITDSETTRAKVKRLVRGFAETLDPEGRIFEGLRYPGYTYDKLVIGLLDAYTWAGDANALPVLNATTRAAKPHMPDHALTPQEQHERPHKNETYTWDETYTMAENLFLAFERTGDRMFFDMARRYLLDQTFFDPLAQGQDILPDLHAYSHVNALSSGMQGYLKLGDPKYLRAVQFAVERLWNDQSFATGGWGPNEAFVEAGKGQLGASLSETHRSFETPCGAYAHFKVMRYLLSVTKDARYGDSLERILYNTILGAWPVQDDGSTFYYSDYHYSAAKTYRREIPGATYRWDRDGRWPCCSGTLPQAVADYAINAYFRAGDEVYVNLYVPSRAAWTSDSIRCAITQDTNYPNETLTTLRLELSRPLEFPLYLRIPAWAGRGTSLALNGKRVTTTLAPGTFARLQREWKNNDTVELDLDETVRTEAVDRQNPDTVAMLRGPLTLFAISDGMIELPRSDLSRPQLSRAANNDWVLGSGESRLLLRPFADIGTETYQTYLQAVDERGYLPRQNPVSAAANSSDT
jgi:DUF1680 family protein